MTTRRVGMLCVLALGAGEGSLEAEALALYAQQRQVQANEQSRIERAIRTLEMRRWVQLPKKTKTALAFSCDPICVQYQVFVSGMLAVVLRVGSRRPLLARTYQLTAAGVAERWTSHKFFSISGLV